jgi:response regulator RpfG family c-di-GMP phosphodiesterase
LPVSVREVLLDAYAQHGAEILTELDWPAPVVELVRVHRARWDARGAVPLAARILAAAEVHRSVAQAPAGDGAQSRAVIEELTRHAGRRLAPEVVAAFIERIRGSRAV